MSFIQIDEEGFFMSGGLRLQDEALCYALLAQLKVEDRAYVIDMAGQKTSVEAFDEPYVVRGISGRGELTLPYGVKKETAWESLCLDEWDRVHGRTREGVPFVLNRSAQMELFDLADEFDDDSITLNGQHYPLMTQNERDENSPSPSRSGDPLKAQYWEASYQDWKQQGATPGWDLAAAAKPLIEVLPQIKLPKSRICVLGSGAGHDAAYLAAQGHIVTAVDFSPLAIEKARELYPESTNLKYITGDALAFAQARRGEFDIVFEHTFFCAVPPHLRPNVVKAWRQLLCEGGHLLGIFFVMDRLGGPPYGASEWEIRTRLNSGFQPLYWTRWRTSIPKRQGKELVVYATKKP